MRYNGAAEQGEAGLFLKLSYALTEARRKTQMSDEELILLAMGPGEYMLPVSAFRARGLGILECTVRYLHDYEGLGFGRIARILSRDNRTVWSTYHNSLRKHPGKIACPAGEFLVPAKIFQDRKLGVLEALVLYLRKRFGLRFSEIGVLIGRDPRTVWTVHRRAVAK